MVMGIRLLQNLSIISKKFPSFQIRELNDLSFPALRYLNTLNISANTNLQAIWKNTFRPLLNLQTLYCNFNPNLSHIHPQAFNNEWSLREVRIYYFLPSRVQVSRFHLNYETPSRADERGKNADALGLSSRIKVLVF